MTTRLAGIVKTINVVGNFAPVEVSIQYQLKIAFINLSSNTKVITHIQVIAPVHIYKVRTPFAGRLIDNAVCYRIGIVAIATIDTPIKRINCLWILGIEIGVKVPLMVDLVLKQWITNSNIVRIYIINNGIEQVY